MRGDRIIEVNKFNLSYDGLINIKFKYDGIDYSLTPALTPDMIFKIIKNEGIEDLFPTLDFYIDGVNFSKTVLLFEVFDTEYDELSFLTSDMQDNYMDSGIVLIECEIKNDD